MRRIGSNIRKKNAEGRSNRMTKNIIEYTLDEMDLQIGVQDVALEPSEGHRIGISNKNVAGSLGGLLSVLADRQINVIDLINKSRGEIAYNLIDIAEPPSEQVLSDLLAIETVMGVRAIESEIR